MRRFRNFLRSARDLGERHRLSGLSVFLFYTTLANIPFWVVSRCLGLLPIGWVCVEYALVGLLAIFFPRILVALILFVAIAADLTSAVSKTYYLAPSDCLAYIYLLHELPGRRLLALAGMSLLTLLVVAVSTWLPTAEIRGKCRYLTALALSGFAVLALAGDYLSVAREEGAMANPFHSFRPGDTNRFSNFSNLWIGRYPVIRLWREGILFGVNEGTNSASLNNTLPIPSATSLALVSAGVHSGRPQVELPDLVIVLVESWGFNSNPAVRDSLVHPYKTPDLMAKYEVSQGEVSFYGSTVGGESRELCNSRIGPQIANISMKGLQRCLPDWLATLGYHSIALHGMSGSMFSRRSWYKTIGFQEEWFRDRFRAEGLPDCGGAFVGTCDAALAKWIGQRLQKREANPDFTYWVTLNSHLPLPVPSGLPLGAPCSLTPLLLSQPPFCSWYQLVSNVHESVSQLANGKLGRPTVFVIVGDHAPPFANYELRSQFSSTEVPYILLVPRRDRSPSRHQ